MNRHDAREMVEAFLTELSRIMRAPGFHVDSDLDILPKKKNEDPLDPYTTANTLAALEFDRHDVRAQLLALRVADYVETMPDDKGPALPPFYVFCRILDARDVYIKIKIRDSARGKVFCVSFHFARHPFVRPLPYES